MRKELKHQDWALFRQWVKWVGQRGQWLSSYTTHSFACGYNREREREREASNLNIFQCNLWISFKSLLHYHSCLTEAIHPWGCVQLNGPLFYYTLLLIFMASAYIFSHYHPIYPNSFIQTYDCVLLCFTFLVFPFPMSSQFASPCLSNMDFLSS